MLVPVIIFPSMYWPAGDLYITNVWFGALLLLLALLLMFSAWLFLLLLWCGVVLMECRISINNLPRLLWPTPLHVPQKVSFQVLPSSKCLLSVSRSCCRRVSVENFCIRKCFMTCILMLSQSSRSCTCLPSRLDSPGVAHFLSCDLKDVSTDLEAWNACSTVGYVSSSRVTLD